jgi:hypothetical protein
MASETSLSFSVASVVEDVLQQHGHPLKHLDFDSRIAQQAGTYFLIIILILILFTLLPFCLNFCYLDFFVSYTEISKCLI